MRRARKNKLFLFSAAIITGLSILSYALADDPEKASPEQYYLVQKGDTLWQIAERYYPNQHTGKQVYMLRKTNNIDNAGELQIGSVLIIPGS